MPKPLAIDASCHCCGTNAKMLLWQDDLNRYFCHSCDTDYLDKQFMVAYCEDCNAEFYNTDLDPPFRCPTCKDKLKKRKVCPHKLLKLYIDNFKNEEASIGRKRGLKYLPKELGLDPHIGIATLVGKLAFENNCKPNEIIDAANKRAIMDQGVDQLILEHRDQAMGVFRAINADHICDKQNMSSAFFAAYQHRIKLTVCQYDEDGSADLPF